MKPSSVYGVLVALALTGATGCEFVADLDTKVGSGTTASSTGPVGSGGHDSGGAGGAGGEGGGGHGGCVLSAEGLSGDPKNCGYCGHDCLGGQCTGGACEADPFECGVDPFRIIVDAKRVFWTDFASKRVMAKPKSGGETSTLSNTVHPPYDIHPDIEGIFFTEYGPSGFVHMVHKDGDVDEVMFGPGLPFVRTLDVEWDAFAVTGSNDGSGSDSFIARVPKDNTAPKVIRSATAPTNVVALINDNSFVYFTDAAQNLVGRIPLAGGLVDVIDDTSVAPAPLWLWLDNAIWADAAGIRRKAKNGGGLVQNLGSTPYAATALAFDATYIYFTAPNGDEPDGVVGRVRTDSTDQEPEILMKGANPIALAVDDFGVYVAMRGAGCIMRIAK